MRPEGMNLFENNPFIERLPPIRNINQIYNFLLEENVFTDADRVLPEEYKIHLLHKLKNLFLPTSRVLDLEKKISLLIRTGYIERNPLEKSEYELLFSEGVLYDKSNTYSESFSLIGIPGVGKSKAVEKALSYYPKVIFHPSPINRYQIPWLKIDCAHDSSLKTICLTFFSEIDRLLGTNYIKNYGLKAFSTSAMVLNMRHLARLHAIGILVIDEIQYLLSGRGVSYEQIMNFFVSLTNSVGIPILLVGTMRAKEILQRDFRQARRSCGVGDLVWENFQQDEQEWKALVKTIWENQLLEEIPDLTPNLYELIYDRTQGVVDILVKLLYLSQMRAIELGLKKIEAGLIKRVSDEDLQMVKPMLKALKSKDPKELIKYNDIILLNTNTNSKNTKKNENNLNIQDKASQNKKKGKLSEEAFYYLKDMDVKHHKLDILIETVIKDYGLDTVPNIVFKVMELISEEKTKPKNYLEPGVIEKVMELKQKPNFKENIHQYLKEIKFIKEISYV